MFGRITLDRNQAVDHHRESTKIKLYDGRRQSSSWEKIGYKRVGETFRDNPLFSEDVETSIADSR